MIQTNASLRGLPATTPLLAPEEDLDDITSTAEVAKKQLGQGTETLPPNLKNKRIAHWKHVETKEPEEKPSNSMASRIVSWVANTRVSIWVAVKVFQATRIGILLGSPSENRRSTVDKTVDELSGSMHMSKTIHAITPAIAAWVQERLIALDLHESVSQFLKGEHLTLQTFIDALLPTVYINIAKAIRIDTQTTAAEPRAPVSLVDVTCYVCEILNAHLPAINARIDEIDKIEDPVRRERKLCYLFVPMVEDFMTVALPEGVKELPVTHVPIVSMVYQYFWKNVQKRILPSMFLDIYRQLASPLKETKKLELSSKPGGQSLVSIAEMAGDKAAEVLAALISVKPKNDEHTGAPRQSTPLAGILTKSFSDLVNGSDQLKQWLSGWFLAQLSEFGSSTRIEIKQMWKLMAGYLEPMLIHVFTSMSSLPVYEPSGRLPDVIGIIFIRFFTITSQFFNVHRKAINERIEALQLTDIPPYTDAVLLKIFKPLANDLLEMMGLHDPKILPIPGFFKTSVVEHLREIVPGILLRQYFAISNSNIDDNDTRKRLRELFFDPKGTQDPEVAVKVVSALHSMGFVSSTDLYQRFYKELWNESGTERIAKTIEGMCSFFAEEIVSAMTRYFGLSAQERFKLAVNPFMQSIVAYIKKQVEVDLLDTVVHITEKAQNKIPEIETKHPKYLLPATIMKELMRIFTKGLKGVEGRLSELNEKNLSSVQTTQEANQVFADLAAELHAFGGVNPFRYLPLGDLPAPESIKETLWESIKDVALPDMSRKTYAHLTKWHSETKISYAELEQCFHTTHPAWACRVLAQYASDYIKHFLTTSNDEAAKLLLESLTHYFNKTEGVNSSQTEVELDPSTEPMLSKNIATFAADQNPQMSELWQSLTIYAEAFFAKFFAEISKAIQEVETNHPDFMVDLAIQILKDTTEHFSAVVQAGEDTKEEHMYRLKIPDMLKAFGDKLHDGVPLDPAASPEEKRKTRLQGCFIPLADKLLKLANLTVKDLPIPSLIQEQLGGLLINEVLPLSLMQAFQKLLEPQVRDGMMLSFIQTLYSALNGAETLQKNEALEEAVQQPDPKRRKLYETCGQLALELVKLLPDTVVQYIFMKEKVKNMSAEALGDAMMPHLSRWTLLQMVDTMIYHGLLSMHPSKWEGKLGRETLVPRKAFMRPDGKMELKVVKRFKFDFSETEAQKAYRKEEEVHVRKQLRDGFTKTISQQLHIKAWEFIKSLWDSFQSQLNDFIEGRYPDKWMQIKAYADKVFHKVFFDFLGPIVQFITTPLVLAAKYIVERTFVDKRSQDVIENIHSDITENLYYKWIHTVFDSLLRLSRAR